MEEINKYKTRDSMGPEDRPSELNEFEVSHGKSINTIAEAPTLDEDTEGRFDANDSGYNERYVY